MKLQHIILLLLLAGISRFIMAAEYVDLPECNALVATDGKYRLGMVSPMDNPDLEVRLYELGLFYEDLAICRTGWDQVLPTTQPWAPSPQLEKYIGYGVYAAALLVTLLLTTLLPIAWCRHITVLGLLGVMAVTWLLGASGLTLANSLGITKDLFFNQVILLQESRGDEQWFEVTGVWDLDRQLMKAGLEPNMSMSHLRAKADGKHFMLRSEPNSQVVTEVVAKDVTVTPTGAHTVVGEQLMLEVEVAQEVPEEEPFTSTNEADESSDQEAFWVASDVVDVGPAILSPEGLRFRVHRPLNIRQSPGIQHSLLDGSPLHRGTRVEVISRPYGNWWHVRVIESGSEGWVNSLWLRRDEG